MPQILNFLVSANDILSAGIAITAFSLLLYSLTFNLRERVARVFAALLLCITIVYFCKAVVGTASGPAVNLWLRLQWMGIAFIPAAYLHFSDALLATTGLTSRWRRRLWLTKVTATSRWGLFPATRAAAGALSSARRGRCRAGSRRSAPTP